MTIETYDVKKESWPDKLTKPRVIALCLYGLAFSLFGFVTATIHLLIFNNLLQEYVRFKRSYSPPGWRSATFFSLTSKKQPARFIIITLVQVILVAYLMPALLSVHRQEITLMLGVIHGALLFMHVHNAENARWEQ